MGIQHRLEPGRFWAEVEGHVVELDCQRRGAQLIFHHTCSASALQGRGQAGQLVQHALHWAASLGLQLVPGRSYVNRIRPGTFLPTRSRFGARSVNPSRSGSPSQRSCRRTDPGEKSTGRKIPISRSSQTSSLWATESLSASGRRGLDGDAHATRPAWRGQPSSLSDFARGTRCSQTVMDASSLVSARPRKRHCRAAASVVGIAVQPDRGCPVAISVDEGNTPSPMRGLKTTLRPRQPWTACMFADEDQAAKLIRDPVAPAQRSAAAMKKVQNHTLDDGTPVHSFRTLMATLSGIVRNTCRTPGGGPDAPTFEKSTTPNQKQRRALELIDQIKP